MYVPLNRKTDNYLKSSMIKIKDLIDFALKHSITSLTITDNNMFGVIEFYKMCIKNKIKPIVGLEVNINDYIIVLYAKDYNGYLNLVKLSTIMSKNNIEIETLKKYKDSLICIIPYESKELYSDLKSIYKDLFLAYKNFEEKKQLTGKVVYMNKITYLYKQNVNDMKYLEAIKDGVGVKFIKTDYADNYFKLENEIDNDINTLKNNYLINEMCNLEIIFNQDLMPRYINELNIDSYSYLKKMCILGARQKFGLSIAKNYQDRLKYELDIINKMGFSDYFLIVSDYVNYAKENNIIVGCGRGSAVSSLVAYVLNITDVDPIKYDLLFERFLNPERINMPDIDIDFEHEKRDDVINYCINKYGIKKVAPIIAFGTLGAKAAIRDVGRSLEINLTLIDNICKLLDSTLTLKENYNASKNLQDYLSRKKELFDLYKIAMHFEGLKRHTTIHAAGIVMSNNDLDNVIPLYDHDNFYTSGYDMTYLEEIGLLKMDFLAIKYLTTIHNIIDLINKNHNLNIKFDDIDINDKKAIEIFNKADTIGIFQFESAGMINFLSKLKPNSFDDIIASIALFRPGPMKNIPTYIKRKNNLEKIDYLDDSLIEILKPTYGIIIYQEQIMQIARVMADYTLGEADILRKAMSKKNKKLLEQQKEIFTSRSMKKGYKKEVVDYVFESMLKFASYGFNKSHSVGYSYVALKMAYLKGYFRKEFYTCLLESEKASKDKIKIYIYELKKYNIDVKNPDINLSEFEYSIKSEDIIYPLSAIKGININASKLIIEERKSGPFKDIFNFLSRCYGKVVNKRIVEILILSGTFDSFKMTRKTLINNLDIIINYSELLKDLGEYALKPEIEYFDEYTNVEIMNFELECFGLYLKNHPVTHARINKSNITMLSNIEAMFDRNINLVVLVDSIKEVETKDKDKMAFITGSDEVTSVSIVLFPKVYQNCNLNKGDIIYLTGKVEKRYDKYQVIAQKIDKID